MLTLKQIRELYQANLKIKFKKKHPQRLKGEYDPGTLEAIVYIPNAESKEDRDITILHELIHARDDIKGLRTQYEKYKKKIEDQVEKEAVETYKNRPYVLQFIKQLYDIK